MISAVAASSRAASGSLASTSTAVAPAASQAPAWAVALRKRFPCRDEPIDRLIEEVTLRQDPADPIFVSGPPASGKTAVVRALLHAASLRHAYVSCVEAATPRALLSSVLHQLRGGKRIRDDGYAAGVKCDSISDFLLALADACRAAANAARRRAPGTRCSGTDAESPPPCWVVIDHAERLADTELLGALLRMRAVCGPNIGLLLIASLPHGDGGFGGMGSADGASLAQVDFPGYSLAQLAQARRSCCRLGRALLLAAVAPCRVCRNGACQSKSPTFPAQKNCVQIMEARHQRLAGGRDELVFRQFLRLFLPAFWRVSNNLLDLQAG